MYLCTTREVHRCTNRECTTHALKSGPVHKSRSAPLHISRMYQTQIKKCTCAQIKKCTAAQIETVPDTNQEGHLRANQEVYLCTNREVCQVGRVLHAADWSEPQNTFPAVMQRPNIYINFKTEPIQIQQDVKCAEPSQASSVNMSHANAHIAACAKCITLSAKCVTPMRLESAGNH